jgi:hypothetical protein
MMTETARLQMEDESKCSVYKENGRDRFRKF